MKTTKQLQEESEEASAKFWAARNNTVITIGQIGTWVNEIYEGINHSQVNGGVLIYRLNKKMTKFALEKTE